MVGVLLCISMVGMLVLILVLLILISKPVGLMLLCLWSLLLISVLLSLLWSRLASRLTPARRARLAPWLAAAAAAGLVGVLIGGAAADAGMLTFSIGCWVSAGSLLASSLINGAGAYSVRGGVLPVWAYDPISGATSQANASVLSALGALGVLLLWGVIAGYTALLTPATLICYLAASAFYMFALHAVHAGQLDVTKLCDDLTPEMVLQAVHVIRRAHAGAEKSRRTLPAASGHAAAGSSLPLSTSSSSLATPASCAAALHLDSLTVAVAPEASALNALFQFGGPAHAQLRSVLDFLYIYCPHGWCSTSYIYATLMAGARLPTP